VLSRLTDGWLVYLGSLSDPDLVPSAVAGVLGLRSKTISPEAGALEIADPKE